jgi:hypothetical protein
VVGSLTIRVRAVDVVSDGHGGKRPRYEVTIITGGANRSSSRSAFVPVSPPTSTRVALRQVVVFLVGVAKAERGEIRLYPVPVEDSARAKRAELRTL